MLLDDIIRIKSKADSVRREPDLPHALLWDSHVKIEERAAAAGDEAAADSEADAEAGGGERGEAREAVVGALLGARYAKQELRVSAFPSWSLGTREAREARGAS